MRDDHLDKIKREYLKLLDEYLEDYPDEMLWVETKRLEIEELYNQVEDEN